LGVAESALHDAAYRYFAQFMQGEEPFHPFVSTLLLTPFPSFQNALQSMPPPNASLLPPDEPSVSPSFFHSEDLVIETSNVHWWLSAAKLDPPGPASVQFQSHSYWQQLHESQQRALLQAEQTRLHMIYGGECTSTTGMGVCDCSHSI
jgi:hypothetical protein